MKWYIKSSLHDWETELPGDVYCEFEYAYRDEPNAEDIAFEIQMEAEQMEIGEEFTEKGIYIKRVA